MLQHIWCVSITLIPPCLLFFLRASVAFMKQLIILVGIVSLVNLVFFRRRVRGLLGTQDVSTVCWRITVSRTTRFSEFLNFLLLWQRLLGYLG